MKQLIFFTAIILISCVIVSAVIIPANAQQGNLEQIIEAIEDEDNLYLLKSNNGTLCVYLKQTGELIMNTETSTLGTIVNIPEMESVACNTLFEKYKSGFAPHAFVKLRTI